MLRATSKILSVGDRLDPGWSFQRRLPPPTYVGALGGLESASSGAMSIRPGSIATGDTEFIGIESAAGQPATISTAGWQQAPNSPQDGSDSCLSVWWKRYTSGDGFATIDDSGDHQVAYGICIRGLKANPIVASAGVTSAAAANQPVPEVTTNVWNAAILVFASAGADVNQTEVGTAQAAGTQHWAGTWVGANMFIGKLHGRFSLIGGGGGVCFGMGIKEVPGPIGSVTMVTGSALAMPTITLAVR